MFSIDKRTLDDCTHGAIRVVNLRGMKTLMITLCSQYDGHGRQRFYLADKHIEVLHTIKRHDRDVWESCIKDVNFSPRNGIDPHVVVNFTDRTSQKVMFMWQRDAENEAEHHMRAYIPFTPA